MTAVGLANSKTEVNRLLKQGAVSVDGERVDPSARELVVAPGETRLFKVGKRSFVRVIFE